MPAGTLLSDAIAQSLALAFPGYQQRININPALAVQAADEAGPYAGLTKFAMFIHRLSQKILGGTHRGVQISIQDKTIFVFDDSAVTTPINLNFQDLVGQPTWIDAATINFKIIMRADIQIGDYVKFPTGIFSPYALTTQKAAAPGTPARDKSVFQGVFVVNEVHHFGNFRQPTGNDWVTAFNAVAVSG